MWLPKLWAACLFMWNLFATKQLHIKHYGLKLGGAVVFEFKTYRSRSNEIQKSKDVLFLEERPVPGIHHITSTHIFRCPDIQMSRCSDIQISGIRYQISGIRYQKIVEITKKMFLKSFKPSERAH